MKISILDQAPIASGNTAQEALNESVKLAQHAEKLGYTRYWIAEHHDLNGLACPAPDVMLGIIGSKTNRIRIGAGAVLLPHYKPFHVAETYNLLATLFPRRIDLGVGRAPGGSAEAAMALSDNFLENVRHFPDSLDELIQFLQTSFPREHMYSKIRPTPVPSTSPAVWLLGTSDKSAELAAEKGLPYAFGHFMSMKNGPAIADTYRQQFRKNSPAQTPEVIITVSAVCAETTEAAEEIALSSLVWNVMNGKGEGNRGIPAAEEAKAYPLTAEEKETILQKKGNMIIGSPEEVIKQLQEIQQLYQADEVMILTIAHDYKKRLKSYELISEQLKFI